MFSYHVHSACTLSSQEKRLHNEFIYFRTDWRDESAGARHESAAGILSQDQQEPHAAGPA